MPFAFGACSSSYGSDADPPVDDASSEAAVDALAPDSLSPGDGGLPDAFDAEVDATYNVDWNIPSLWNAVDLSKINLGVSTFVGAVFDGRYVYFAPSNNTPSNAFAARYDTLGGALTAISSWEFFDTASLSPNARGFEGAYFDGRYVVFVPFANATEHVGLVTRFDTKAGRAFNDALAWQTFDTSTLNANARGYIGGAFDGQKYAYLAPGIGNFADGGRPQALVARQDTIGAFSSAASWSFFDTQTVGAVAPRGFVGAIHTGQHLYLVPYGYAGAQRGRVVRYAVNGPFDSVSSWEVFDLAGVDPDAVGFQGGAFDGRHVYFVPLLNAGGTHHGNVARFDTQGSFSDGASWEVFDLGGFDGGVPPDVDASTIQRAGYIGAGFDGRFLYLSPSVSAGGFHGWIARFDTRSPTLASAGAWSFYDATGLNPDARGFAGAVFDGQYMYFVPTFKPVVVRFYAKFPAVMPPFVRGGSFL